MNNKLKIFCSDLFGGISGGIAALPQTVGLSVLLFTSFGMSASDGAVAGLTGAFILLLSSGITGATRGMISAPNGPVTILLSGLVVKLVPDYSPNDILVIISAVLFFTGVFQIFFGLMKGGELVKLIPYPVVASMITAIGILMIKTQFIHLMPSQTVSGWYKFIPCITAGLTLLSIFLFKKFFPSLPTLLMGLGTGVLIYPLLTLSMESKSSKWVIGNLPAVDLSAFIHRLRGINPESLPWYLIISSALALTILVVIDCLLTALVADAQTAKRHDAGRELIAQGAGQILTGLAGGVGGGGTKGPTLANIMAGGGRWSPLYAALVILFMALFGRGAGSYLPLSAFSGVIIYIGLKMINIDIFLWFKEKYTRIDALNTILVIGSTIVFDVSTAVGLGLVFSVITYILRGIKRSLIRRETDIIDYPSPRKRNKKYRKILEEHRDKALMIELQGDLYFATTDQLYRSVLDRIKGRHIIILHFRRVLSVDMSGMVLLMQLVEIAGQQGTEIVFTHLHRRLGFGRKMKNAFTMIQSKKKSITKIFHSTARALEYAEDMILKREYKEKEYRKTSSVEFEKNNLCTNLDKKSIDLLLKVSEIKNYKSREVVLKRGELNSSLFLVTNGFVEQRLYNGKTSYKVLAKYSPGTFFGKGSFFSPKLSATTFTAVGKTTVYKIRRKELENNYSEIESDFLINFLFAIGSELSNESSGLISEIRRLEAL